MTEPRPGAAGFRPKRAGLPGGTRRVPAGSGGRLATSALLLATTLATAPGCYHLIEPVRPPSIPVDESLGPYPPGIVLRIENGHPPGPADLLWIRSDGVHHMVVDLRDWTGRLVSDLARELGRRRVLASVPSDSLRGTSAAAADVPRSEEAAEGQRRALVVWATEVRAPPPGAASGFFVSAEVESPDGGLAGRYESTPGARTFPEALHEVERAILSDPRLRRWLEAP